MAEAWRMNIGDDGSAERAYLQALQQTLNGAQK